MSSGECLQTNRSSDTNEPAAVAGKQSKSMKVFLRNTQSGWYFQEPSKWTPAQEEALDIEQTSLPEDAGVGRLECEVKRSARRDKKGPSSVGPDQGAVDPRPVA